MTTKEQIKELIKSYLLRTIQCILFWLPVRRNRIMFYVHARKGFTCNPKYIVQKLYGDYGNRLEIIWTTLYPDSCQELTEMGIAVMTANSRENIRAYFRTRVYITNDAFPSWALHRWNQKWINTWHGGMNYKHIGYDYLPPMDICEKWLFHIKNRRPDIYLSGSGFFTENTASSFLLPSHIFVPSGLPRNDLFFGNDNALKSKIRKTLGVGGTVNIVLYAPTFRQGLEVTTHGLDVPLLLQSLERRFGGTWIALFRNHYFVQKGTIGNEHIIDVSDYPDMQELLYVSSVLISDFSSCMWDFCLTKRPCFVYANDIGQYIEKDRSLACPMDEWPFPIAGTNEELQDNILHFDCRDYTKKVNGHLSRMGSYDMGNASERAVQFVKKYCFMDNE